MSDVRLSHAAIARLVASSPVMDELEERGERVAEAYRSAVGSRRLAANTEVQRDADDRGPLVTVGPRGAGSFFAFFVEFGTIRQAGNAALTSALDHAR
ncbi:MAG TPA: hypothetical protein VM345_01935 [Acidimicrobiales bacterium]|nr:hypothetical protein [Acidimicrobiales bacterium]